MAARPPPPKTAAAVAAPGVAAAAAPAPAQATNAALAAQPSGPHGEYNVQYADLPADTQAQLDIVQKIIERYPTAADAEKDGWIKATVNLKGIASHYLKQGPAGFLSIDDKFDVNNPEILLFNGEGHDAPILGVSYLVKGPAPEGFPGKWDVWHNHQAVCFAGGLVTGELGGHHDSKINMTEASCKAEGGIVFPLADLNMLHVWMVPGEPSTAGVFSHDHQDAPQ